MAPAAQAKRFELLMGLIAAGRLRLVDHPELLKELRQARLTRHAGGRTTVAAPRKAGAHDDVLDALLLAVERAATLPPIGGDVFCEQSRSGYFAPGAGLVGFERRWYRRLANGNATPTDPPPGSLEFADHARALLAQGMMTPAVESWLRSEAAARGDDPDAAVARALNGGGISIPIAHH